MANSQPPAPDDHAAYFQVHHSDPDQVIVDKISDHLAAPDVLTTNEIDDQLFVVFRGRQYRIPLTNTFHDRYVTISSLAELLKEHYRFFLLESSMLSDTHELLVATNAEAQTWSSLPQHLAELQPGVDYFAGMRVPYLDNENSAPDFARDGRRWLEAKAAMEKFMLSAIVEKKVDRTVCAGLAKLVTKDPALRAETGWLTPDASDEEISSAIYEVLCAVLDNPDKKKAFRDFYSAIRMVEVLTGGRWPTPTD